MHVTVLHNRVSPQAAPDEQDVLVQADAVAAALAVLGHEVTRLDCDLDLAALASTLTEIRPDIIFNLVESLGGHGRLIHLAPGLLDVLGLPYAGSSAEALFLTGHKVLAKEMLRGAGLPTPDWLVPGAAAAGSNRTAGRWIIKSIWEDASLGMDDRAVTTGGPEAARRLLSERTGTPGAPWFAEAFVDGREFNFALLDGPAGPEVLPPAEMQFEDYPPDKPRIVGYAAKWQPDSFEYGHTVRRFALPATDAPLLLEMERLALASWKLFVLQGWARVDFRVDPAGRPWILEVNANPCISPDAGFVAAADRAGVQFERVVERIVGDIPDRAATRKD